MQAPDKDTRSADTNTLYWMATTFVLFPVLILLGIYMRTVQAGGLSGLQSWFYPMMTLHGLGMAGVWYVASMACVSDMLSRYSTPSPRIGRFALYGTTLGVLLLLVCVFIGRFGAGWYFLYPLPLKGDWPAWSMVTFLVALTVLGATWLIWTLDLLRAIAKRYTLSQALAWHYLVGRSEPVVPPSVLITTVSLIACVGETEADAKTGRISYNSPIGRALIGRKVDDEVEVSVPAGDRYYLVSKIEFI